MGSSPRLLPTIFKSLPCFTTPTLASVGPPVGAALFTYLATSGLFTFHPSVPLLAPAGRMNAPATLVPA
jgi:hypothetical protein